MLIEYCRTYTLLLAIMKLKEYLTVSPSPQTLTMDKALRNTSIFIVFIILGVQWGFYVPYTSQFPNFVNQTNIIHVHGALLMTWLCLLVLQPFLIGTGRAQLHRTIGKISWVLGPAIILTIFLVGRSSYNRHFTEGPVEINRAIMVLDIRGLFTFALFWALAMINRKNSSAHMRYMIATGILGIGPGVGRGLISSFGFNLVQALTIADVIDLVIVGALLGYDIVNKKNYKPYLVVFIALLIGTILWQLRASDGWQAFAKAYAALLY